MKSLSDLKKAIFEIKNSDFMIGEIKYYEENYKASNLLRNALICNNYIGCNESISEEEKIELFKELDEIMKNKLKALNPSFSDETLNNMINTYKRGFIVYPMDIFVIDDAVFHKEGIFNDFGSIYKIRTFMFENMKPYYNIFDIYFTLHDVDIFSDQKNEWLSNEDAMYISKFLSDNINSIYKENITKPTYELNNDKYFYGYSGISEGEIRGINVYINKKFDDLGKSIKEKTECDIKLCIQNKDDIIIYYVHQSFKDDKPIWSVVKTSNEVWKLTEMGLKSENKHSNSPYSLTRKKFN